MASLMCVCVSAEGDGEEGRVGLSSGVRSTRWLMSLENMAKGHRWGAQPRRLPVRQARQQARRFEREQRVQRGSEVGRGRRQVARRLARGGATQARLPLVLSPPSSLSGRLNIRSFGRVNTEGTNKATGNQNLASCAEWQTPRTEWQSFSQYSLRSSALPRPVSSCMHRSIMARRTELLEQMHHWLQLRDNVGVTGFFEQDEGTKDGVAEFLDKFDIQHKCVPSLARCRSLTNELLQRLRWQHTQPFGRGATFYAPGRRSRRRHSLPRLYSFSCLLGKPSTYSRLISRARKPFCTTHATYTRWGFW
jgi:hypothetical protein